MSNSEKSTSRQFHDDDTDAIDPDALAAAESEESEEAGDEPEEAWEADPAQPDASPDPEGESDDVADDEDAGEDEDDGGESPKRATEREPVVTFTPGPRGGAREVSGDPRGRTFKVMQEQAAAKRVAAAEGDYESEMTELASRFVQSSDGGYWVITRTGWNYLPDAEKGNLGFRVKNSEIQRGKCIEDLIRARCGGGVYLCSPRLATGAIAAGVPEHETTIAGEIIPFTDEGRAWLERRKAKEGGTSGKSADAIRGELAQIAEANARQQQELFRYLGEIQRQAREEQSNLLASLIKAQGDGREADRQRLAAELEERRISAKQAEAEAMRRHEADLAARRETQETANRLLLAKLEEEKAERRAKEIAAERALEAEREERRRRDEQEREERRRRDDELREERRAREQREADERRQALEQARIAAETQARIQLEQMRLTYLRDKNRDGGGSVGAIVRKTKARVAEAVAEAELAKVKAQMGIPEPEPEKNWLDGLVDMMKPVVPMIASKFLKMPMPPQQAEQESEDDEQDADEQPVGELNFQPTAGALPGAPAQPQPLVPPVVPGSDTSVEPEPAPAATEDKNVAALARIAEQRKALAQKQRAASVGKFMYGLSIHCGTRPRDGWNAPFDDNDTTLAEVFDYMPEDFRGMLESGQKREFLAAAKELAPVEFAALYSLLQEDEKAKVYLTSLLESGPWEEPQPDTDEDVETDEEASS